MFIVHWLHIRISDPGFGTFPVSQKVRGIKGQKYFCTICTAWHVERPKVPQIPSFRRLCAGQGRSRLEFFVTLCQINLSLGSQMVTWGPSLVPIFHRSPSIPEVIHRHPMSSNNTQNRPRACPQSILWLFTVNLSDSSKSASAVLLGLFDGHPNIYQRYYPYIAHIYLVYSRYIKWVNHCILKPNVWTLWATVASQRSIFHLWKVSYCRPLFHISRSPKINQKHPF